MLKTGISSSALGKRVEKHRERGGGKAFNGDCSEFFYLRRDIRALVSPHCIFKG